MSTGNQRRSRTMRVSALPLPPGQWVTLLRRLRHGDALLRLGLCLLAAVVLWAVTGAWSPPFPYRTGHVPPRDLVARVKFKVPDPEQTRLQRRQAVTGTICVYEHDKKALVDLQRQLKADVFEVTQAASFEQVPTATWRRFLPLVPEHSTADEEQYFQDFRTALAEDMQLAQLEDAVRRALEPHERYGLLDRLSHTADEGDQAAIVVHPLGNEALGERMEVPKVRISEAAAQLPQRLEAELRAVMVPDAKAPQLAQLLDNWFRSRGLPVTLRWNRPATQRAYELALAAVPEATYEFQEGERLVDGGVPLLDKDLELLRREYLAIERHPLQMIQHSLADLGMFVALYILCGCYIYYHNRQVIEDLRRLSTLLGLVVATVILAVIAARDNWRAEVIPLVLFGMAVTVAYHREMALLLTASVALVVCLSLGESLAQFVILMASVSSAVMLLGRIRSRTRLIFVGLGAGAAATLTALGVGTLAGQPYGASDMSEWLAVGANSGVGSLNFGLRLVLGAAWYGVCVVLAGFLMAGLLPFVERLFDVQTDLSLLELGDAAHPLLQELARRAPGTYNHSINVASIGEAAAEAIGANGLLVRVGAYFHDIGKMLKPGYFVENQGSDGSRHESLLPAMSTLVIIAHVKDGADLARQHHLPQSLIDFIQQHHGTTLVEYFYRQAAARQSAEQEPAAPLDETPFRYPGPKPQTREAGVLMLADAVESACRTLTDPAPARIESLVDDIAMKRLMDGQFDECGLTLKELQTVEESLVKSLTSVYHGRVKYPSQQTA
ncbi:MAG: HDIG domain-containing protein [Pirellulaceae bacterium]|nr:HDIG domain-containing protein [Pirellulaceae bacterium]